MRHEADKNSENSCQLIPTDYMTKQIKTSGADERIWNE